ncbi:MAG: hypothetical protein HQ591_03320 [candidate division Zixibacteria bacterium]|nr:hypothetical protein [Candidatus Tariuqbacter arcticus]
MKSDKPKKMWLLFLVVKESLVQDILNAFLELDISGATIVNSQGMGRTLAYEFPIYAAFLSEMRSSKPYNKTIFTAVDDLELLDKLQILLKEIDIDFTKPDTGVIFTVPISRAIGTNFDFIDEERKYEDVN